MSENVVKSTFEQWVTHIFEESEESVSDPNADYVWYDFDEHPEIMVAYIGRLFASPDEHTSGYSDKQINRMLWTLISEIEQYMYELFNEEIPFGLRVQVVKDMYTVYERLLAPRCSNSMSGFKEHEYLNKLNPLNSICFMWWDIIPLYGKSGDPSREVLDPHCINVMERTLRLKSIACQEGALHGLGHWKSAYPDRVVKIVDEYLAREIDIDSELREYALAARTGMIL